MLNLADGRAALELGMMRFEHYVLDGIERTAESYVTDTWVRRDGRRQGVRRHTAPVSPGVP